MVENSSWLLLIAKEGLVWNVVVLELNQHQLFVSSEERTRVVAVVASCWLLHFVNLDQIVNYNGSLSEYSGCCFGGWNVGVVTEGEDIAILVMSQSKLININHTCSSCEW